MIRPRIGDFLYSGDEIDVMLRDIRIFKKYGVRGIVVGILTKEGRVDTERMKRLGNSVSCHYLHLSSLFRIVDEALPLEGNCLPDQSMDNRLFNTSSMNQFAFIAHLT
jgi:CutC family